MTSRLRTLLILALPALLTALLGVAVQWLSPASPSPGEVALAMVGSAVLSVGLWAVVLWLAQRGQVRLWLALALTYAVGVLIALANVLITVQLMVIDAGDLRLLLALLIFAAAISLALGVILATTLATRVRRVGEAARALAAGDPGVRAPPQGSDEVADLARTFNAMADRLAAADAERTRIETARRELVAAVSHDLRTPLAAIRALAEALADGLVSDAGTTQRYASTIRTQVGRLSALIDDLFDLTQLEASAGQGVREPVALADLVSDTLEAFGPQAASQGVQLSGQVASDVPTLLVSARQIDRVLANLVSNAIRHTPPGGAVRILAAYVGEPERMVQVTIADTGEGIDAQDLPHIFDRFYRGDKSRSRETGGAGLGLAIARTIIEAHGGHIRAESARGQGTRVWFTLPA